MSLKITERRVFKLKSLFWSRKICITETWPELASTPIITSLPTWYCAAAELFTYDREHSDLKSTKYKNKITQFSDFRPLCRQVMKRAGKLMKQNFTPISLIVVLLVWNVLDKLPLYFFHNNIFLTIPIHTINICLKFTFPM